MADTHVSPAAPQTASANKWLIALAVMLATILEVLDITIANVAVDHIRGNLSAGVDEAAWVLTSYIVGNAIVIPLTGWLSSVFGRKRFFLFSVTLFTTSSLLCGLAPNLEILVFFRALQGLSGGVMMPLSQAILMETFPPEEQGTAMAVWGTGMMVGPISGPMLGGWITENYSWRWIFFINVPVGTIAAVLIALILVDPPYIKRAMNRIDWPGIFFLVLGVACLQVLLDRGERVDWFSSDLIRTLGVLSGIGLVLFVIQELRTKDPVVDLRILKNYTFAVGTTFTTLIMFGMYGSFLLISLYCQILAGYTPLLAGKVMSIQTFSTFLSVILAGRLYNRLDPRLLVFLGCLSAGYGAWNMTHFNPYIDFWSIAWPGVFRGFGSGFLFVPLTTLTLGAVPKEHMGNASGLFNMVRSIGGGIGIAVLIALLSRGAQIHQNYLTAHIHPYNPEVWQRVAAASSGTLAGLSENGGNGALFLALVYKEVQHQALLMAFVDDFRLIAYSFFFLSPVVF